MRSIASLYLPKIAQDMMMIRNDIVKEVDYLASRAPVAIPGLAKSEGPRSCDVKHRIAATFYVDPTSQAKTLHPIIGPKSFQSI